jgi:hypothetical protein
VTDEPGAVWPSATRAEARGRKPAALVASGLTVREAAARLKVGKSMLYNALGGARAAHPGSCV